MDMKKLLIYIQGISENLDGLLKTVGEALPPEKGALYVNKEQKTDYVGECEAIRIIEDIGKDCMSAMLGNTDFIIIYDKSDVFAIDGNTYLHSGYLVMKSCDGLKPLYRSDIEHVLAELESREIMLAVGDRRIHVLQLG